MARPINLGFAILPNPDVLISLEEGFLGGVAYWDSPADLDSLLRWDVVIYKQGSGVWLNYLEYSVSIDTAASIFGQNRPYVLVPVTPNNSYQIKVQAISKYGDRSPFSIVTIHTTDSIVPGVVPRPVNFISTNAVSTQYTGSSFSLSWDVTQDTNLVSNVEVQIVEPLSQETIRSEILAPSVLQYTYTIDKNKQDYFSYNTSVGAYRTLVPRIRSKKGDSYSDWVYLGG